jgi:hypothetical protein
MPILYPMRFFNEQKKYHSIHFANNELILFKTFLVLHFYQCAHGFIILFFQIKAIMKVRNVLGIYCIL